MKKYFFILAFMIICGNVNAQCVAEVKDVLIDNVRGSIIVETQYKLNNTIVDVRANPDPDAIGRSRYTEENGTLIEIRQKAQEDIKRHCENLIIRNAVRINGLNGRKLEIIKSLTTPLASSLKTQAIGWTTSVSTKVIQFKNKEITIEADGSYTITDITP